MKKLAAVILTLVMALVSIVALVGATALAEPEICEANISSYVTTPSEGDPAAEESCWLVEFEESGDQYGFCLYGNAPEGTIHLKDASGVEFDGVLYDGSF